MDDVVKIDAERVAAIAVYNYDRYDYPHMDEGDVVMVIRLLVSQGIGFYRDKDSDRVPMF